MKTKPLRASVVYKIPTLVLSSQKKNSAVTWSDLLQRGVTE